MGTPSTDHVTLAKLIEYASRDLDEAETTTLEAHVFTCDECGSLVAELDDLLRAIRSAVRSTGLVGFVTDDVLNQMAREGIRVRSFTLSPGARVPCAVWDDDEVLAVRYRGDFGDAKEITLRQHLDGSEILRLSMNLEPEARGWTSGELIQIISAARVRQLPSAEIQLTLSAPESGGAERTIGRYTLVHEGSLRR